MDSELEENMVEWLREIGMPVEFVNKLARMFQDIKVSEDLNQRFKENLHDQEPTTAGNRDGSLALAQLDSMNWVGIDDVMPSRPIHSVL